MSRPSTSLPAALAIAALLPLAPLLHGAPDPDTPPNPVASSHPMSALGEASALSEATTLAEAWGAVGHGYAATAALETLPEGMPDFFLEAGDQLVWLNPEPDRWRDSDYPEMNEGFRYDHYIDLENIPDPSILDEAGDRWQFYAALLEAGVENPQRDVGFLPFAVVELQQRLVNGFVRWRTTEDPVERRWIQERIINDAGIMGHFITDGSQPHHTTIHFNGWDEDQVENPGGFTTDRGFHSRFETRFVTAHVEQAHVTPRTVERTPRDLSHDVRGEVIAFVREVNGHVHELYRIDRDHGFEPDEPADPVSLEFAAERIADGAAMLRDLWWSAWVESEAVAREN